MILAPNSNPDHNSNHLKLSSIFLLSFFLLHIFQAVLQTSSNAQTRDVFQNPGNVIIMMIVAIKVMRWNALMKLATRPISGLYLDSECRLRRFEYALVKNILVDLKLTRCSITECRLFELPGLQWQNYCNLIGREECDYFINFVLVKSAGKNLWKQKYESHNNLNVPIYQTATVVVIELNRALLALGKLGKTVAETLSSINILSTQKMFPSLPRAYVRWIVNTDCLVIRYKSLIYSTI